MGLPQDASRRHQILDHALACEAQKKGGGHLKRMGPGHGPTVLRLLLVEFRSTPKARGEGGGSDP